jgi:hypothetical protein
MSITENLDAHHKALALKRPNRPTGFLAPDFRGLGAGNALTMSNRSG